MIYSSISMTNKQDKKIRVLVVDDSLFMRCLVKDMLNSDPQIEVVDTAKDGKEAIKKISQIKPDCITLDLVMSGWDGLTTLQHIMNEYPTPCVILSAHSRHDADITIKCLNAGAISFVLKPSGELSLNIESVKALLLNEVKAASKAKVARIKSLVGRGTALRVYAGKERRARAVGKIIVIGASTGGPQTLETIISSLPMDFSVAIIIVQHMPSKYFSESLAERFNRISDLKVEVAQDGDIIGAGRIYIAPALFQMRLERRKNNDSVICLSEERSGNLSPSIDITMESVAKIYNEHALGIILTGMGHDGREGMKVIKQAGGKTIVQDESSLIFGMPKSVIDAGFADKVLPMEKMSKAMLNGVS